MPSRMKLILSAAIFLWCFQRGPEAGISARVSAAYYSKSSHTSLNPDNFLALKSRFSPSAGILTDGEKEKPFPGASLLTFSDYVEIDSVEEPDLKNRINELYLTFPFLSMVFLDAGKIVDRNGVAFFMNPTDFLILNKPDMNAESKESVERFYEGLTMARIQVLFPALTVEAGYAPRIVWNDAWWFLGHFLSSMQKNELFYGKIGGTLKGIDIKGIFAYDSMIKAGLNSSKAIGDRIELHAEVALKEKYNDWFLTKVQFMTPDSSILSYDSSYSIPRNWSVSMVTGGHYSFSNGINLMLEYFFNGEGLAPSDMRAMQKSMSDSRQAFDTPQFRNFSLRSLQSYKAIIEHNGIPGLSRHYIMERLFIPIGSSLSLEGIQVQSFSDFSGSIIIRTSISMKWVDFSFSAMMPYGTANSEFGCSLSDLTLGFIGELRF
jgi:hypothetical protein